MAAFASWALLARRGSAMFCGCLSYCALQIFSLFVEFPAVDPITSSTFVMISGFVECCNKLKIVDDQNWHLSISKLAVEI